MDFESTFRLDKKFLRELRKRLIKEFKEPFGFKIKTSSKLLELIPTIEQLEEIITVVFWASTQVEEGRPLNFRVAYEPPIDAEHLGLKFDLFGIPWTVEEVRRLAPAVVPPDGHICVYDFMNHLCIFGLQTTHFFGVSFEVLEPARVVVKLPLDVKVAEITGQKTRFIDQSWRDSVFETMSIDLKPTGYEAAWSSLLTREMTTEILKRVRLLKHGGTILFVGDGNNWQKSVEKPIRYRSQSPFNGLRHIKERLKSRILDRISANLEKIEQREQSILEAATELEVGVEQLQRGDYKIFIADGARTVAYLTAVDGATVLSRDFDVLAFGVKIKELQKGRTPQMLIRNLPFEGDDQTSEVLLTEEFRGKRHLSTARFVLNNPGSVAFTVSQDGGITGFTMQEGKLIANRGLEILF